MWKVLGDEVLPALWARFPQQVRVWFSGCAGGEEVYSFRILWEMKRKNLPSLPQLLVVAKDLSPQCLERGQRGLYSPSSLRDIPPSVLSRFFAGPSFRIHSVRYLPGW